MKEIKDSASEMLDSISLQGSASEENKELKVIIASRSHIFSILDTASGMPKVRSSVINKFSFILSQPALIRALSPLSIRCCLCGKVISYPSWYYSVRYAINQFHYFICFNGSNDKPIAKCYRKA